MPTAKNPSAPRGRPSAPKTAGDGVQKRRGRPAGTKNKRKAGDDDEDDDQVDNSRAKQRQRAPASSPSVQQESASEAEAEEDDDEDMDNEEGSSRNQPSRVVVDDDDEDDDVEEKIPPALVARILQEHFKKGETRITREANALAARYVDIFVREAMLRAAEKKRGGFVDVEDLEKISPQLLLDL